MFLACTSFFRETVSKVHHLKSFTFYPSISLSTLLYLLLYKENRCHTENLIPTNPHPFICIHTHLSLLLIPQTEFLTRILDLHTSFWLGNPCSMVLFSTCLFLLHWLFSLSIWTCSNLCVVLKKPVAVLVFFFSFSSQTSWRSCSPVFTSSSPIQS